MSGAGVPELDWRSVARLLAVALAAFSGAFLLLSVVPLYAAALGAREAEAGLTTGVFMFSTVAAQLGMPWLLTRIGYRAALAAGLLFLGLPALLYPLTAELLALLAVTLARGVGFGIVTVVGSAVIAELFPEYRRGEGVGLYGIAVGLPTLLCLPLGVWLAENVGFSVVFLAGALAPLLGLLAVGGVSVVSPEAHMSGGEVVRGLSRGRLLRPTLMLAAVTVGMGAVITFLPLSVSGSGLGSAATGLFLLGAFSTAARWWAGRLSDRYGASGLLAPGLLAAALGLVALAGSDSSSLLLVAGASAFGIGYGVMQNATLILMLGRVERSEYGLASALWNIAFDAGTGAGAFALGFVVQTAGFGPALGVGAALISMTLLVVYRDRRLTYRQAPDNDSKKQM